MNIEVKKINTMKTKILTRKIEIYPTGEGKVRDEGYQAIYKLRDVCMSAANYAAAHCFSVAANSDILYMADGKSLPLKNIETDSEGILTCSRENMLYRALSKIYKGDVPMEIISDICRDVTKNFKAEQKDVMNGKKGLRSYKKNIPVPIPSKVLLRTLAYKKESKNFTFILPLYKNEFTTRLGQDRSGNGRIIKKGLEEADGYKICGSKIKCSVGTNKEGIKKHKMFLLLSIQMPVSKTLLNSEKTVYASLNKTGFIEVFIGDEKPTVIGDVAGYVYKTKQKEAYYSKMQAAQVTSRGGRGRKRKLLAMDRLAHNEHNFRENMQHNHSKWLIDFCKKNDSQNLVLLDQDKKEEEARSDKMFLRHWGFNGMDEKIKYKANLANIVIQRINSSDLLVKNIS